MRTWLLHIGERLPVDADARCYRYGYLAQELTNQGHEVLRWAPTFSHFDKKHRFRSDHRVDVAPRYSIQFVHSPGYHRNVSLNRVWAYQVLGRRLSSLMAREPRPDLIVAAIPSLEWATAAIDYGRARDVPVVLDIRDLWPDVFLNAVPRFARATGEFVLRPYRRQAERVCREADALVGVSQGYLDWALTLANRGRESQDAVLPIGFEPEPIEPGILAASRDKLRGQGINLSRPTCLFSGSFERSYDLETLLSAANILRSCGQSHLQFVLCGDGSNRHALEKQARRLNLTNVFFLGWVNAAMLQAVASISQIGICAYAASATQGLPNKPFEYMAGRLANVSSLRGELAELLERHQCGISYEPGSPDSLAEVLGQLLQDPDLLDGLRRRGYETWQRHFQTKSIYPRFVTRLESLACVRQLAA